MKKKYIITFFAVLAAAVVLTAAGLLLVSRYHRFKGHTLAAGAGERYYCPMHPGYTSDRPGDCPICNMKLVKKQEAQKIEETAKTAQEICIMHNCPMADCPMQLSGDIKDCPFCGAHLTKGKKILYWRNPMNPEITSPVPMKDPMGMDYVPVYEQGSSAAAGLSLSSERQQFIGVKREKALVRKLRRQITTVGKVAYDPELFVAQEEYLSALRTKKQLASSSVAEELNSLARSAERKLSLLGMTSGQIEDLAKADRPQANLYLPAQEQTVWVYMTIYEFEMGLVGAGQSVRIEAVAFPGEVFEGKIAGLTPVLDPMTRSIQARAEVGNPNNKLKPQMFVTAHIEVDLGEKLSIAKEAVINTGKKTLVVVINEKGNFFSKEVKLGWEAEDYYEVLAGLSEGDVVVTSGNFLIDSESRLQGIQ